MGGPPAPPPVRGLLIEVSVKGRTIRKVMGGGGGGGGGEFSIRRNFFSLSNSLNEFFSGPCMNIS